MLYSKRKIKSVNLKSVIFAGLFCAILVFLVSCGDPLNKFHGGTEDDFRAFSIESDSFEYFEGFDMNEFPDLFDNLSEDEKLILKNQISDKGDISKSGYIINLSSKKIHLKDCGFAETIKENNRQESDDIEYYLSLGFSKCGTCFDDE